MRQRCEKCCFGGRCESAEICGYFTSLGDEYDERRMDDLIKERRIEFLAEWFEYIEGFNS